MDANLIEDYTELIDGWILHYDEVSNNFYRFELTDKFGRKAACTDFEFERGIETCISYALDIEMQLHKGYNKCLFDIFTLLLSDKELTEKVYYEKVFGSWTIQLNNSRIILDGKEYMIVLQYQDEHKVWCNKENVKLPDLKFENIKRWTNILENKI